MKRLFHNPKQYQQSGMGETYNYTTLLLLFMCNIYRNSSKGKTPNGICRCCFSGTLSQLKVFDSVRVIPHYLANKSLKLGLLKVLDPQDELGIQNRMMLGSDTEHQADLGNYVIFSILTSEVLVNIFCGTCTDIYKLISDSNSGQGYMRNSVELCYQDQGEQKNLGEVLILMLSFLRSSTTYHFVTFPNLQVLSKSRKCRKSTLSHFHNLAFQHRIRHRSTWQHQSGDIFTNLNEGKFLF